MATSNLRDTSDQEFISIRAAVRGPMRNGVWMAGAY